MKTIRIFETHSLILILGAVLGIGVSLGLASAAFAQTVSQAVIVNPDGKLTYLGTLGGVFSGSVPAAINDSGQVVGYSQITDGGPHHAFITGPNGKGMNGLGTLGGTESRAHDINDSGRVVGYSATTNATHAFITGPNGEGMTDLGALGGDYSEASGINDSGQVVGVSYTTDGSRHVFTTGPNGKGMTDLGTPGGGDHSDAYGINDSGQVVGTSIFRSSTGGYGFIINSEYAFITGPDGEGVTGLGTLGGDNSSALGINDSGQVVGYSNIADGSRHAFITGSNGKGMTDLGTLGGDSSWASGINDSGQVVGASLTADGSNSYHAFITGPDGKGMTDLNSYADLPDGYSLTSASDINNQGQVIATLIVPEPASYALMLAGLGLVGFMARGKRMAANIVARG